MKPLIKYIAKALMKSDTTNSGNVDYEELARVAVRKMAKRLKKKSK